MASTTEESWFTFSDGGKVFHEKWIPSTPPIAKLIFIHGFSDHINRYYNLFPTLASAHSIETVAWDQRGWGRSVTKPSEKGLTGPSSRIYADVAEIIASELPSKSSSDAATKSDIPIYLMGHSMGGGILLTFASLPQYVPLLQRTTGSILLESPLIRLPAARSPSKVKVFVGRLAGHLAPHFQLYERVDPSLVSRDPEVEKSLSEDPLCHNTGTLEMFAAMLDRSADLDGGKVRLGGGVKKVVLWQGTGDQLVAWEGGREFLEREGLPVKEGGKKVDAVKGTVAEKELEWVPLEGWAHMLHSDLNEACRKEWAGMVGDWIVGRSKEGGGIMGKKGDASSAPATVVGQAKL